MEIKTTTQIFQEHRKVLKDVRLDKYVNASKKKWVAVDDIIFRLYYIRDTPKADSATMTIKDIRSEINKFLRELKRRE